MCGICGFIDYRKSSGLDILEEMTKTLNHRGPNDRGCNVFENDKFEVGFGQSRLSIIDLSMNGHQPMFYKNFSIVFNGEIYNYSEIKDELINLGHIFISNSDTEVILHSFEQWGELCVNRFIGMFSFSIFDNVTNKVFLFRDRAGVKPLYYYWFDGLFLFASELKPFHKNPNFKKELNFLSIKEYVNYGHVPSPLCIFKYSYKLEPGHILIFDIEEKSYLIKKYWDVNTFYNLKKLNLNYTEAKLDLEKILKSAFDYRMVSDVPVGVFLSGGYDSTAVAAILQHDRKEKIKTFTIGFSNSNEKLNEAPFAKKIAAYLGTDHTEYYCTSEDAKKIIFDLPYFFDEPFADSSAIPTILVSQIAKKKVTVCLSADGGDEIFAGYKYYQSYTQSLKYLLRIPYIFRLALKKLLMYYVKLFPKSKYSLKLPRYIHSMSFSDQLLPQALHRSFFKVNPDITKKLFINSDTSNETYFEEYNFKDSLSVALANDYKMYLQNDVLTKVDRATMSVSLEGREPFLDHRIIEFVAQLPSKFKFGNVQKKILKDIVHKYVPQKLLDRPKTGFEIPINDWLKNDLSYLIDNYLNQEIIESSKIFSYQYVNKLKNDFKLDLLDDPTIIWKLLQFQMWYKKWM